MSGEAGGNPSEGCQGGELVGALAESMAGLADMFGLIMEDAETVAQRDVVSSAPALYEEEHSQAIVDVQRHGLQPAESIQAGAGEDAKNDLESVDDYQAPWDLRSLLSIRRRSK